MAYQKQLVMKSEKLRRYQDEVRRLEELRVREV